MKLKKGVKLNGMGSEILLGIMVANEVYKSHGIEMVITSVTDSVHGWSSEHYKGDAADIRISNIPTKALQVQIANEIRKNLGSEFDVILEGNHIHIEYDPKQ